MNSLNRKIADLVSNGKSPVEIKEYLKSTYRIAIAQSALLQRIKKINDAAQYGQTIL